MGSESAKNVFEKLPAPSNYEKCVDAYAHDTRLRASAQTTSLALGQTAPDAKAFVVGERIFEALRLDLTLSANLLRVSGRPTFFGEKGLRVSLGAERICLPRKGTIVIVRAPDAWDSKSDRVDEPVIGN